MQAQSVNSFHVQLGPETEVSATTRQVIDVVAFNAPVTWPTTVPFAIDPDGCSVVTAIRSAAPDWTSTTSLFGLERACAWVLSPHGVVTVPVTAGWRR